MKKRRIRNQEKLIKEKCELCGYNEISSLEIHHIIPRTDKRCHNNNSNLAIICGNCHNELHAGNLQILGVYFSTNGRIVFWKKNNIMYPFELEEKFWLIHPNDNKKVITRALIKK